MSTTSAAPSNRDFYAYDHVYRFDEKNRLQIGVVYGSYEMTDEDYSSLEKGQIHVFWNDSAKKQVCRKSKVNLMNRCVIPGNIVRRTGQEGQRGYCKSARFSTTLQILESDKIIEHVSDARLFPPRTYDVGDAICVEGNKFGRIMETDEILRLQSKCGSLIEVKLSENRGIRDCWLHTYGYVEPCYPGQSVTCTPMQLRDITWLKKSKRIKRRMELAHTFTIQSVDTYLIQMFYQNTPNGISYIRDITKDDLKTVKILPIKTDGWILDRQLLKIRATDVLIKKSEWLRKKSAQLQPAKAAPKPAEPKTDANELDDDWCTDEEGEGGDEAHRPNVTTLHRRDSYTFSTKNARQRRQAAPKLNKFYPGAIVAVEVLCCEGRATIVWQDGTEEVDVPTTELYFPLGFDDHEFFPGECVVSVHATEAAERYGVVQKVNFLDRIADIKWFVYSEEERAPKEVGQSELSVYDIKKHEKYVFRPGSVVKNNPVVPYQMGKVLDSCPEGFVVVEWLNGNVENCWPQHIEVILDWEGEGDFPDDFDFESDDDFSWETESIESYNGDVIDEIGLQNLATKVEFIRNRISYLYDLFKQHNIRNFSYVKNLISVYENSIYLDKYLGTNFFSKDSNHFKALYREAKKKGETIDQIMPEKPNHTYSHLSNTVSNLEKDSIKKLMKLEWHLNAEIKQSIQQQSDACNKTPPPPPPPPLSSNDENLTVELLLMLKIRMDLVYAEIISRICSQKALSVLSNDGAKAVLPLPSADDIIALTPEEKKLKLVGDLLPNTEAFCLVEEAPVTHHFFSERFNPSNMKKLTIQLQKEYRMLNESLPGGVWVRSYDDRIDLLSVMIRGPAKTPYEDGLFLFDVQLCVEYPARPPFVHFISFSSEQLNPNLYVEGKVCVSLLGTWLGRDSEVWGPNSNLLQLFVSIQGLILVAEPYYNEDGYERQANTEQGRENSRVYNEAVLLKLVQAMGEMLKAPPMVFRCEVLAHFRENGERMCERLMAYCADEVREMPEFNLLPVSKGCKLSLRGAVEGFREVLRKVMSGEGE